MARDRKHAAKHAKSASDVKDNKKKGKKGKGKFVEGMVAVNPDTVDTQTLVTFSKQALFDYGSYVVEDRAVPDFRDGLKPVQRRLIYSMYRLGLGHKTKHKKSARVVGDTLGLYHPHGDAAAYGALVGLANTTPKVVDGQGNWGSPVDNAAAQRYTECRLSAFADLFLLDPDFIKVVPHEPNYDDTVTLPMYLPSTIPTLLLLGNAGGIAYGVRACNPSFKFEGVAKLTKLALEGKKITAKLCLKYLEVEAPFGSRCVSSPEEIQAFIETGRATLKYVPQIVVNEKLKRVEIKSYAPGFASQDGIDKKAEKICKLPSVAKWHSNCGKKNPKAGPYGCYYYVEPKRGVDVQGLYDIADEIEKILTGSEYYCLGITVRRQGKNSFHYCTYAKFMEVWVKYRVKLEEDYLRRIIGLTEIELARLELLLYAVQNRKKILAVLNKALEAKDPDQYLAKALKIPVEKAKAILDMQVRKLAKLEESDLIAKIKETRMTIKNLHVDLKNPAPRTVAHITKTVNQFLKLQK